MNIIVLVFIAAAAFVIGYFLGNLDEPPMKEVIEIKPIENTESIDKEYQNFLNYDGSEQF